jgi:hypothetical protein
VDKSNYNAKAQQVYKLRKHHNITIKDEHRSIAIDVFGKAIEPRIKWFYKLTSLMALDKMITDAGLDHDGLIELLNKSTAPEQPKVDDKKLKALLHDFPEFKPFVVDRLSVLARLSEGVLNQRLYADGDFSVEMKGLMDNDEDVLHEFLNSQET